MDGGGGRERPRRPAEAKYKPQHHRLLTFVYTGCGFRLWAQKGTALGIFEVFLDGTSLGNVDLYAAAPAAAAVVFSKLDVTLGLHVVKVKNTNTRNASSTDNTIIADALEVLP